MEYKLLNSDSWQVTIPRCRRFSVATLATSQQCASKRAKRSSSSLSADWCASMRTLSASSRRDFAFAVRSFIT